MGVEIVKASVVHAKGLSGNAYKVLISMSLMALDKPKDGRPASLYFGGWDHLALALGYSDVTRGTAGHNAVARAVRELKKAGHVSPLIDACRGSRQSYLLHPGGLNLSGKGEQNAHAKGEQSAHVKGEQNSPQRVSKTLTPRTHRGSDDDLPQDIHPQSATELQTARDDEGSKEETGPHKFRGQPGDDCDACGLSYLNRQTHPLHLLRSESA